MTSNTFSIFFRCDANSETGMGHLSRCVSLAVNLSNDFDIHFIVDNSTKLEFGHLLDSYKVLTINHLEDLSAFELINSPSFLIIDSYEFTLEYYKQIREDFPQFFVLAFDDFKEKFQLPINGLINISLSSESYEPPAKLKNTSIWGVKFYRPTSKLRKIIPNEPKNIGNEISICVTMGGSDPEEQSHRLRRLSKELIDKNNIKKITIILGPSFENPDQFIEETLNYTNVQAIFSPQDFFNQLNNHDLIINGGGMTSLEIGYLKKPQLILCLAENQLLSVETLKSKGFATSLGFFSEISDKELIERVLSATEDYPSLVKKSFSLYNELTQDQKKNTINSLFQNLKKIHLAPQDFTIQEVKNDYILSKNTNLDNVSSFEVAKWSSQESMLNRFKLGLNVIPWKNISTWLDIGSGAGDFLETVEEHYKNIHFHGVDLSPTMIQLANKKKFTSKKVRFEEANFTLLDRANFDLVTSIGVLQKCGVSPFIYFSKIYSLLKPGQYHFFTTKNLSWERFLEKNFSPYEGHKWFLPNDLESTISISGFEIISKGGFLPNENTVVEMKESHTIFYLLKKVIL